MARLGSSGTQNAQIMHGHEGIGMSLGGVTSLPAYRDPGVGVELLAAVRRLLPELAYGVQLRS